MQHLQAKFNACPFGLTGAINRSALRANSAERRRNVAKNAGGDNCYGVAFNDYRLRMSALPAEV
jgi:hypothetical protein